MHMDTFSTVLIFSNRSQVLQHKQTCDILWLIFFFPERKKKKCNFLAIREKKNLLTFTVNEKPEVFKQNTICFN